MWYLKISAVFLVVVALLLFGLANRGNSVIIHWWGLSDAASQVNLALGLFAAYGLGVVSFLVISLFREFGLRRRCTELMRQAERMRRELDALRMAPLEEPLARETPQEVASVMAAEE